MNISAEDRFWRKVDQSGECWVWTKALDSDGYGRFFIKPYRGLLAHRVSYEWERGTIPKGLTLDHLCRVRSCVRPSHLEPVTRKENTLRGIGIQAVNARKTHCIHGHEFTPENTYQKQPIGRDCRACNRRRVAAYKARKAVTA